MNIYTKQIYISKRPSVRKVLPITTDNEHDYFIIKYCQVLFDILQDNLILWETFFSQCCQMWTDFQHKAVSRNIPSSVS